jgi:hypothetical protein
VLRRGSASDRQLRLPLGNPGDETAPGTHGADAPVMGTDLMERVVEAKNLLAALRQVRRNRGAPGIDGMAVDDLVGHLQANWPTIRASLVTGTYQPQPVRRVVIPKAGGGSRNLGVPVVLDRFVEQTLLQVLQGIHRFLKAGVFTLEGVTEPTVEGTPQGSPLSPLLANLLLDDLDKELEQRGHRFVRYADDGNIYVRSQRSGERVMASATRFLERKLKLKVNAAKSAVDRPWNRKFLGFTFTRGRVPRRKVSAKAVLAFKASVRELTRRTRGRTIRQIVKELRTYILGWRGYFGYAEVNSPLLELNKWIRRRLRSYHWKQWGRRGYRELRKRGVSCVLAWNTAKSAHGPWRLSQSPALTIALPARYFAALGLPNLVEVRTGH